MSGTQAWVTITVAALPTFGTAGLAYLRWRSTSRQERERRAAAALQASQLAVEAARSEEQRMRDALLASQQSTIERLETMLLEEQRENERLRDAIAQRDREERRRVRREGGSS